MFLKLVNVKKVKRVFHKKKSYYDKITKYLLFL